MEDMTSGAAKSKTSGALDAAKEKVGEIFSSDDDEDADDDKETAPARKARPRRRRREESE
jgi:hypothetical protein